MMMMMRRRRRRRRRRMMILNNCLLHQNLQPFLDLKIVVEEIKVVVMKNNKVMMLPSSTVEDLQKIGSDGTVWQLADTGNNAPGKEIYVVGWLLETYRRSLMVTMFVFELSCKINYFQEEALVTTYYEKILALHPILKDT
jgi:hypothetical protein